MSTQPTPPASPSVSPPQVLHPASRHQLEWLRRESATWQAEGLIAPETAGRILARYSPSRGLSLGRLVLILGACFFGVGLIWLVASNLENLSPLLRFGVVVLVWLFFLLGSEALHRRNASPVVVGTGRTLAAFAIGAVIFQAAQSLQVPAYDSGLIGAWGAAALLHAYVTRARGPLLVGLAGFTGWSLWHGFGDGNSYGDFVWTIALTGLLLIAVAALQGKAYVHFAPSWRTVGAAVVLAALFVACLPISDSLDLTFGVWHVTLAALAVAAAGLALVRGGRLERAEVALAAASAVGALVMGAWVAADNADRIGAADVLHAVVGVLLYVGLAVGIAVSGTLRDSTALTAITTIGLVIFTTFQSFAVFGEIIEGAWLFLALGMIFLLTGVAFDRARRRIAAEIADELTPEPISEPISEPTAEPTEGSDR